MALQHLTNYPNFEKRIAFASPFFKIERFYMVILTYPTALSGSFYIWPTLHQNLRLQTWVIKWLIRFPALNLIVYYYLRARENNTMNKISLKSGIYSVIATFSNLKFSAKKCYVI